MGGVRDRYMEVTDRRVVTYRWVRVRDRWVEVTDRRVMCF